MISWRLQWFIFSGETSSGKSTLVNRLSGKRILTSGNLESTATVCKLRNSERIKIITEHMSGKTEEVDLTDKCDPNTKEGEKMLRNTLKSLTDITSSEKSKTYRAVEICLPIPFLKVIFLIPVRHYVFETFILYDRMY